MSVETLTGTRSERRTQNLPQAEAWPARKVRRRERKGTPNCGIYNSLELQGLMEYERRRMTRTGEAPTLLVCKLNGTRYSQRELRRLMQTVTGRVRETDHIGWRSGDEFVIVLPGATPAYAEGLGDILRTAALLRGGTVTVSSLEA